jgi:NADPH:quinone reductase-like Zn-dependent oxidoreductase
VTGWSPGSRLIAMIGHRRPGGKGVVPAAMAVPLPEGRSFEEGRH